MADRDTLTPGEPPAPTTRVAPCDPPAIFALGRPDRRLLIYYVLFSFVLGPLFFVLLIPLVLRFRTLRYRFDDEGIGMRWGALRRREVDLAYARIQDIHLISNVVERWLGLARIKIQTASGSQKAEVVIEGIREYETLRSYLVDRMRRARRGADASVFANASVLPAPGRPGSAGPSLDIETVAALCASLEAATAELRAMRALIESANKDSNVSAGREGGRA